MTTRLHRVVTQVTYQRATSSEFPAERDSSAPLRPSTQLPQGAASVERDAWLQHEPSAVRTASPSWLQLSWVQPSWVLPSWVLQLSWLPPARVAFSGAPQRS